MIHYHGLSISTDLIAESALRSGHAFVSLRDTRQLGLVLQICQSFALDNGAYSLWKKENKNTEKIKWEHFYKLVEECKKFPSFDFACIPDVIDGTEKENNSLLNQWPFGSFYGAPIWHLHESIKRLEKLVEEYPRICLGSSGNFTNPGTPQWWERIDDAMRVCCDKEGYPKVKIHGLRMLDPALFKKIPLASADSTTVGRNVNLDTKWKSGNYLPPTKEARASILRLRIEVHNSPPKYLFRARFSK